MPTRTERAIALADILKPIAETISADNDGYCSVSISDEVAVSIFTYKGSGGPSATLTISAPDRIADLLLRLFIAAPLQSIPVPPAPMDRVAELIEANNRMEERARRAEAALRPFAEAAAPYLAGRMDHAVDATRVHRVLSLEIGDLRNAAKVIDEIHDWPTPATPAGTSSDAPIGEDTSAAPSGSPASMVVLRNETDFSERCPETGLRVDPIRARLVVDVTGYAKPGQTLTIKVSENGRTARLTDVPIVEEDGRAIAILSDAASVSV